MILLPASVRVYFATAACDLRRSFDGLSNQVRSVLGHDPLCGHVFVFLNRRKTQVKLLLWTRGGFTVVHKRLEAGQFAFPQQVTSTASCGWWTAHLPALPCRRWAPSCCWCPATATPR